MALMQEAILDQPFYTNVQKEGGNCMEQPEKGNIGELVRYRIDTAKSDLLSANILLKEGEYLGKRNLIYIVLKKEEAVNFSVSMEEKSFR